MIDSKNEQSESGQIDIEPDTFTYPDTNNKDIVDEGNTDKICVITKCHVTLYYYIEMSHSLDLRIFSMDDLEMVCTFSFS